MILRHRQCSALRNIAQASLGGELLISDELSGPNGSIVLAMKPDRNEGKHYGKEKQRHKNGWNYYYIKEDGYFAPLTEKQLNKLKESRL